MKNHLIESEIFELAYLRKRQKYRRFMKEPCEVEHEFINPRRGHPTSYAYLRYACLPSEKLSLEIKAGWPEYIPHEDGLGAIAEAVHDGLGASLFLYTCAIQLVEIRANEVESSVAAFYLASTEAMKKLTALPVWE